MRKTILLLALALLVLILPVSAEQPATVSAGSVSVTAGQSAEVAFSISGNTGVAAWLFELTWDATKLSFDNAVCGTPFSTGMFMRNGSEPGKATVMWYHTTDIAEDGPLFFVRFTAAASAPSGPVPIHITCSQGDTINERGQPVQLQVQDGSVDVTASVSSPAHSGGGGSRPSSPETPVPVTAPGAATVEFSDVNREDFFYDPVNWALEREVTKGVGENRFGPGEVCTRAQAVTFLWRAAGSPEPNISTGKFKDIHREDYFYKAVMWALENDITQGTGEDTFSPDAVVTRAQVVTFLWRTAGKERTEHTLAFADVSSGDYFFEPVKWAVQHEITKGTSGTTFSPDDPCSRGQIVTLLYRFYQTEGEVSR